MKQKKKEEIKLTSLQNVKCPQCGGKVNQVWLANYEFLKSNAVFIAECWSGDLNKPSHCHLFRIRVPIDAEVDLRRQQE